MCLVAAAVGTAVGCLAVLSGAPAESAAEFALWGVAGVPALVLGPVIAWNQPRNWICALLSFAGLVVALNGVYGVYRDAAAARALPATGFGAAAALAQGSWVLLYAPWALVLLCFPDGRFIGWLARGSAATLAFASAGFMVLAALAPEAYATPFEESTRLAGPAPWAGPLALALLPVLLVALAVSVLVVVRHGRAASEHARRQFRWLGLAAAVLPLTLLTCWAGYALSGSPSVVVVGLVAASMLLPAVIAAAVVRSDLVDTPRVLSASAAWWVVMTVLAGVVAAASVLTGVGVAALAAVAAVAVAAGAAHAPVQRAIAARLDPTRMRVLDAVRELEAAIADGTRDPRELEHVLISATRVAALRVGYAVPGVDGPLAADGTSLPDGAGAPVTLGGQTVGVVIAEQADDGWTPPREVLGAVALTVELGRERLRLEAALRDVEESRERLLHAGHAERVRLERDLHDGAQQRLVALGLTLRAAQRAMPSGGEEARDLLDAAVAEVSTAVAELRRIARGIRPSVLDDGLSAALAELAARCPTPTQLAVDETVGEVPDLVAETAYFVASEALVNAVKHSGAARIAVSVARDAAGIRLAVHDDGCGGAMPGPGGGLAGLSDRVRALGGVLRVDSPDGVGTVVEAMLPCAS